MLMFLIASASKFGRTSINAKRVCVKCNAFSPSVAMDTGKILENGWRKAAL